MPPKLPPHVKLVKNRLGRPYLYLIRHRGTDKAEKAVRLPDDPRAPEFWVEYARLMELAPVPVAANSVYTLDKAWGGSLDKDEGGSPEWRQMSKKTRLEWRRYRKRIVDVWGNLEVAGIEPKHVLSLRDTYAATPASANNLLRCLSSMMAWSVPRGYRNDNPCREVKPLKGGEGYRPWTWDEIESAEKNLRSDLWWASAVALYTGQRQGDCLSMRWDHISGNILSVKQEKTGKRLAIPLHRNLKAILETIPKCAVTILTSTDRRPWTASGFRSTWRKSKGVPDGVVFHGLRKSAVVTLLEAGCTDAEVSAITGQSREMVEYYAKMVNQGRLASAAILRWENMNDERTVIGNTVGNTR